MSDKKKIPCANRGKRRSLWCYPDKTGYCIYCGRKSLTPCPSCVGHVQRIKDLERELGWSQYASHCFGDCQFRERAEKAESACKIEHDKRVAAEARESALREALKKPCGCTLRLHDSMLIGPELGCHQVKALANLPALAAKTPEKPQPKERIK